MKLTCTAIENLINGCPLNYLLASRGAYSPSSDAAQRGTNVHTICELFAKKDTETLKSFLGNAVNTKHYSFYLSCLQECIKVFNDYQIEPISIEEKIMYPYQTSENEEITLSGKLDLLAKVTIEGKQYTTVIDYKTSAAIKSTDIFKHQLLWYAYTISNLKHIPIDKVMIINFSGIDSAKTTIYQKDVTQKDISWFTHLIEFAIQTEKRGYFQKKPVTCSWCPYSNMCKKLPETVDLDKDKDFVLQLITEYNKTVKHK